MIYSRTLLVCWHILHGVLCLPESKICYDQNSLYQSCQFQIFILFTCNSKIPPSSKMERGEVQIQKTNLACIRARIAKFIQGNSLKVICYGMNIFVISQLLCKRDYSQNNGIWKGILWKTIMFKCGNNCGACGKISTFLDVQDTRCFVETKLSGIQRMHQKQKWWPHRSLLQSAELWKLDICYFLHSNYGLLCQDNNKRYLCVIETTESIKQPAMIDSHELWQKYIDFLSLILCSEWKEPWKATIVLACNVCWRVNVAV